MIPSRATLATPGWLLLGAPLLAATLAMPARAGVTLVSFAVEPRLPSTQDTIHLRVYGYMPFVNWDTPCFAGFSPAVLDGNGIRVSTTYVPAMQCPTVPPPPVDFELPPLAAGSYRLVVDDQGIVLLAQTLVVQPPATELALRHDAFRFRLTWREAGPAGAEHAAQAVRLTDESGYFWFFDPANTEITVKILDGGAVNGHFWVFVSSLTDVAFTLAVEDDRAACGPAASAPCPVRSYDGVAGRNANLIDLAAF